jgi:hypothetical protein
MWETVRRVADMVLTQEYQNALRLGCTTIDAINLSWAAYNGVVLMFSQEGHSLGSHHDLTAKE